MLTLFLGQDLHLHPESYTEFSSIFPLINIASLEQRTRLQVVLAFVFHFLAFVKFLESKKMLHVAFFAVKQT